MLNKLLWIKRAKRSLFFLVYICYDKIKNRDIMIKRYKEYIQEALVELLKKQSIKDISITDLTEKAGIARSTFYRYYSSLDEVIDDYILAIFSKMRKEKSFNFNVQSTIRGFLEIFYDYRDFFRLLARRGLLERVERFLFKVCYEGIKDLGRNSQLNELEAYYYGGASSGFIIGIIIDDYKVSIEEAEKKLGSLLMGDPKKTLDDIKTSRD